MIIKVHPDPDPLIALLQSEQDCKRCGHTGPHEHTDTDEPGSRICWHCARAAADPEHNKPSIGPEWWSQGPRTVYPGRDDEQGQP